MKLHAPIPLGIKVAAASAAVGCIAAIIWRWRTNGSYLRFKTMFGTARVYQVDDDEGETVRLLEVGGIVHSGTYLDERYTELVFEYLKRYDLLFEELAQVRRVCVLGCGGYDYPEHLIAEHPDTVVDAVEIDPAITAIARRYFFLDRLIEEYETEQTGQLNLICADALEFLKSTEARYDAIVNDAFDAGSPPTHLTTLEFVQTIHDRLVPGGLYLTNIVSALEGPASAFLHQQVDLLRSVFADVRIEACAADEFADEDNVIVIARA